MLRYPGRTLLSRNRTAPGVISTATAAVRCLGGAAGGSIGSSSGIHCHPEVEEALRSGQPVVALESTIVAHGMPWPQNLEAALLVEVRGSTRTWVRRQLPPPPLGKQRHPRNSPSPTHAHPTTTPPPSPPPVLKSTVREHGALPATIAVIDGVPTVGLDASQLESLAKGGSQVRKVKCDSGETQHDLSEFSAGFLSSRSYS